MFYVTKGAINPELRRYSMKYHIGQHNKLLLILILISLSTFLILQVMTSYFLSKNYGDSLHIYRCKLCGKEIYKSNGKIYNTQLLVNTWTHDRKNTGDVNCKHKWESMGALHSNLSAPDYVITMLYISIIFLCIALLSICLFVVRLFTKSKPADQRV